MSTARKKQLNKSVSLLKNKSSRSELYMKDMKTDNQYLLHKLSKDNLEDKSTKSKKVTKFDNDLYEESKGKLRTAVINFIKTSSDDYVSYKSMSRYLAKHYDEYKIDILRDCLIEMINKGELLTQKNELYLYKGDGKHYPKIGDLRSLKIKLSDIYYEDGAKRLSMSQSIKYLKIGKTAFYKIIRNHKITPRDELNKKTLTIEQLKSIKKINEKNKANKFWVSNPNDEKVKQVDNEDFLSEIKSLKDLIIKDMERRKIVYKERTNNHEEIKKMIDKLANINHVNSEDTKNISVTLNLSSVAELSSFINCLLKNN